MFNTLQMSLTYKINSLRQSIEHVNIVDFKNNMRLPLHLVFGILYICFVWSIPMVSTLSLLQFVFIFEPQQMDENNLFFRHSQPNNTAVFHLDTTLILKSTRQLFS